ncbi:hypothetical protein BvCmsE55A_03427 [Escherichia coli]|nr:hypothetical protein BvCmsE55A_03427 [Escherichia coli]
MNMPHIAFGYNYNSFYLFSYLISYVLLYENKNHSNYNKGE